MSRHLLVVIGLFYFSSQTFGQSTGIASFVPAGYSIQDSASGDLNKDRLKDYVLILKADEEEEHADTTRPLLLLMRTARDQYQVIARNDSVVLCKSCGGVFGDPYAGITIKNNFFSIEHYGGSNWRWTRIITFRYDTKSSYCTGMPVSHSILLIRTKENWSFMRRKISANCPLQNILMNKAGRAIMNDEEKNVNLCHLVNRQGHSGKVNFAETIPVIV